MVKQLRNAWSAACDNGAAGRESRWSHLPRQPHTTPRQYPANEMQSFDVAGTGTLSGTPRHFPCIPKPKSPRFQGDRSRRQTPRNLVPFAQVALGRLEEGEICGLKRELPRTHSPSQQQRNRSKSKNKYNANANGIANDNSTTWRSNQHRPLRAPRGRRGRGRTAGVTKKPPSGARRAPGRAPAAPCNSTQKIMHDYNRFAAKSGSWGLKPLSSLASPRLGMGSPFHFRRGGPNSDADAMQRLLDGQIDTFGTLLRPRPLPTPPLSAPLSPPFSPAVSTFSAAAAVLNHLDSAGLNSFDRFDLDTFGSNMLSDVFFQSGPEMRSASLVSTWRDEEEEAGGAAATSSGAEEQWGEDEERGGEGERRWGRTAASHPTSPVAWTPASPAPHLAGCYN